MKKMNCEWLNNMHAVSKHLLWNISSKEASEQQIPGCEFISYDALGIAQLLKWCKSSVNYSKAYDCNREWESQGTVCPALDLAAHMLLPFACNGPKAANWTDMD